MPQSRRLGSQYEDHAAEYLLGLGFTLLGRRIKMPSGELDIVAIDNNVLVFIEVKMRTGASDAKLSADRKKVNRLRQAAQEYVHRNSISPTTRIRFDLIVFQNDVLEHERNVFLED